MTSYERSPDYVVGLRPTNKAGDILVLNDHDIVDLLKAAVKREGSQSAFAMRYNVNRTELNSILNGRRRISASIAKALGLRRVYVVEQEAKERSERLSSLAASQAGEAACIEPH
jgi:plasmid maintenance system antidote protein VapI